MYSDYDQAALRRGIEACDWALDQLNCIYNDLEKATQCRIIKGFKLKPVSLAVKKKKVSVTNKAARDAENVLFQLAKVINDISAYRSFNQNLSLSDRDVRNIFDGFLEDIYLRSSICKTLRRIEEAIKEVEDRKKRMLFLLKQGGGKKVRSVTHYRIKTLTTMAGRAVRALRFGGRKKSEVNKDQKSE